MPIIASAQQQNANPNLSPVSLIPQNIMETDWVTITDTIVLPLVVFILLILGAIWVLRYWQLENTYVGTGKPIPNRHRIAIWNQGQFDCMVTKTDDKVVMQEIEIVKDIPQIAEKTNLTTALEEIKKKIRERKLHIYEIKIINRRYIRFRGNKGYGMLISSAPIENSKYHWEYTNGVKTVFGMKQTLRVVDCLGISRQYEAETVNRNIVPVWVIAPRSDPEPREESAFGEQVVSLNLGYGTLKVEGIEVPTKDLAEVVLIMHTVADIYRSIKTKNMAINKLTKMYEETQEDAIGKQYEVNFLKDELGQQPLVVIGEKEYQKQVNASWGWCLLFVVGTICGMYMPQSGINGTERVNPILFVVIIDGVIAVMKYMYEQKQTSTVQKLRQNTMGEKADVSK